MEEKRNGTRAEVNMKINYVDDKHSDKTGKVTNISNGGMYVQTEHAPEVSDHVEGIIDNEDFGKVIWVEGRVVRKNSTGMALTFTNADVMGLHILLISRKAMG
jgi:hypothetical protein